MLHDSDYKSSLLPLLLLGDVLNSRPACPSIVSWPGVKTRRAPRSSRVYGLFGGKKDNNEKGDDAASKV